MIGCGTRVGKGVDGGPQEPPAPNRYRATRATEQRIRARRPRAARIWPVLVAAAVLGVSRAGSAAEAPRAAEVRPNIILVVTDDMDTSAVAHMPRVRSRLVEEGITFSNAFATNPTCCPSRVSLLTGLYSHSHGVRVNIPPQGGFPRLIELGLQKTTVAVWLASAGYETALVGKYVNWYPTPGRETHIPPGWSEWHALFFPESYYGYRMNSNGRVASYGRAPADYQTDVLAARAVEFIRRPHASPFFLYVAPFAPHGPAQMAERHRALLADLKAPRAPSFNEEDVSDKPSWLAGLPRMTPDLIAQMDAFYRRRARALLGVDEMVEGMVRALEETGQLDRTYVLFTSDNGFQLGQHRLDHGKGFPYEASIRVPLIVRGPGVPAGKTLDPFVLNIDFAPTLAALAGVAPPRAMDGRSFARFLGSGPTPTAWREDFVVECWNTPRDADGDSEGQGTPDYRALRTRGHALIEYTGLGESELYDLTADPDQLDNIHRQADAALKRGLADRLQALAQCRGETCGP
jgi:N-acetylglucosamine-6-sulfatase